MNEFELNIKKRDEATAKALHYLSKNEIDLFHFYANAAREYERRAYESEA